MSLDHRKEFIHFPIYIYIFHIKELKSKNKIKIYEKPSHRRMYLLTSYILRENLKSEIFSYIILIIYNNIYIGYIEIKETLRSNR